MSAEELSQLPEETDHFTELPTGSSIGNNPSFSYESILPLITPEEEELTKMIRRGLGGGDGGIMSRPNHIERNSYQRHHRYHRRKPSF